MLLTETERTEALATLHACGIEGTDATASLALVERLASEPTFPAWLDATRGNEVRTLTETYGHDAGRAAYALNRHHRA